MNENVKEDFEIDINIGEENSKANSTNRIPFDLVKEKALKN